jgi:hypothetical protein
MLKSGSNVVAPGPLDKYRGRRKSIRKEKAPPIVREIDLVPQKSSNSFIFIKRKK